MAALRPPQMKTLRLGGLVEIDHGRRSKRDAQDWICKCGIRHQPTRKMVFSIPKFACDVCQQKYLDDHDLVFSLADVTINGESLVRRVFKQDGPTCVENSVCQMVLMNYAMLCILKSVRFDQRMLDLNPDIVTKWYKQEYPFMNAGQNGIAQPSTSHRVLKIIQWLRKKGIPMKDGSTYRIGDCSCIPSTDYEALCEELADGVPLMTSFIPGRGFGKLKYCQIYYPPDYEKFQICNQKHREHNINHIGDEEAQQSLHSQHMVVLLGPATNCEAQERSFIFINSHGMFCPRSCVVGDNKNAVKEGIGKIVDNALIHNAVKFWLPGETAGNSIYRFDDEEDDYINKYKIDPKNQSRLLGRTNIA